MKKPWLILAAVLIALLVSCPSPGGNNPVDPGEPVKPGEPGEPVKPGEQKTMVVFDNTFGVCTAFVYNDLQRRNDDLIAEVPAGQRSKEIEWYKSDNWPFYFAYTIKLKGVSDLTLNYIPINGRDQSWVRIDKGVTTTVYIPPLKDTISSEEKDPPENQQLFPRSLLLLQNKSSYSFVLERGSSPIRPDSISGSTVNSMEKAFYNINTSYFWD